METLGEVLAWARDGFSGLSDTNQRLAVALGLLVLAWWLLRLERALAAGSPGSGWRGWWSKYEGK